MIYKKVMLKGYCKNTVLEKKVKNVSNFSKLKSIIKRAAQKKAF